MWWRWQTVLMPSRWQQRVDAADRAAVAADMDDIGGALLPVLLTPDECAAVVDLYADDALFRAVVDMGRHRYGQGEYRYFQRPYPTPIEDLKQALYPRLLPIAREWWTKLGREAPWPDTLDEWPDICHRADQTKPTALLLKYGPGDWNALHRDLYGAFVFPLQVVINLSEPGVAYTGGEFLLVEQRARAQSRVAQRLCRRDTDMSSPPVNGQYGRLADGRRRRCATGCPRSAPASGTRSD